MIEGEETSCLLLRSTVTGLEVGEEDVECWVVVGVVDMVTFRER